jgi:hypothetical protein
MICDSGLDLDSPMPKAQSAIDFLSSPQQCKQKVESCSTRIFAHENTFRVLRLH